MQHRKKQVETSVEDIARKAKLFFQEKGVLDFSIVSGSHTSWRCRVKLAVRQVGKEIVIGLFEEGSHDIVSARLCTAHHPRINDALEVLHEFFLEEKVTGYNETTRGGEIRYLQCVVERRTGRVQVSFVLNTSYSNAWEDRLKRLFQRDRALWHSFWINVQSRPTNTIFGLEWHHVTGERYVWESLCGKEIPFLPSHFGQANLEMFERLLEDMQEIFPRDQTVAELFSGMGVISIILRPLCHSVTLYEVEPTARASFQELFRRLPSSLQTGCEFVVGDANAAHEVCGRVAAIIVDPPRKGLSAEILRTIVQQSLVHYLLYISCSWKTFERDAKALLDGGFSVAWARSYIFFPGTNHLETMCLFSR